MLTFNDWKETFDSKQGAFIETIWAAMHFRNGEKEHDREINMKIAEAYADYVTEIERLAEKSGATEEMRTMAIRTTKEKKKEIWERRDEAEATINKICEDILKESKEK